MQEKEMEYKMEVRRLREAGIVVPKTLGVPICMRCDTAVTPTTTSFADHFRKSPHSLKKQDYAELWEYVKELRKERIMDEDLLSKYLETSSPRTSCEPLPPVAGLSTHLIYKCPFCKHFSKGLKELCQHIRQTLHEEGKRVTIGSLANIQGISGQSLWRKKGKQLFFPVQSDPVDKVQRSSVVRSIFAGLETVSANRLQPIEKEVNVNPREMSAFVEATRADEKLSRMEIAWKDAVILSGGPRVVGCMLENHVRNAVKGYVQEFFHLARIRGRGEMMESKEVRTAVAAPGVLAKLKEFSFKTPETEEKYAVKCSRLILMALRCSKVNHGSEKMFPKVVLCSQLMKAVDVLANLLGVDRNSDSYITRNASLACGETNFVTSPDRKKRRNTDSHLPESSLEIRAHAIHTVLKAIFHEKASLEVGSEETFVSNFTACLGVFGNGYTTPRLALGIEVSPTLAALAYAAGCCGILSISAWPENGNVEKELEEIRRIHSPAGRYGINKLQELAGKAKSFRESESARAVRVECTDPKHSNCGYVGGMHLSALEVGKTVRSMQRELLDALLGETGILCGTRPPENIMNRLERVHDDEMSREVGYCFDRHPENAEIVDECKKSIQIAFDKMSHMEDEAALEEIQRLLDLIEKASSLLMAIIHLSGGSPGRGTEEGFQAVRNLTHGMRGYFVIANRVASIPIFSKTRSMASGRMKVISRHPDKLSTKLYILFVLLAMPMRGAIRVSRLKEDASLKEREEAVAGYYILVDEKSRSDAIGKMAKAWNRHGLALGGRDYRQWFGGYANDKAIESPNMRYIQEESISFGAQESEDEGNVGTSLQVQAGHSKRTAESHYGRSARPIAGGMNASLDPRALKRFIAASDEWLQDAGLSGPFTPDGITHFRRARKPSDGISSERKSRNPDRKRNSLVTPGGSSNSPEGVGGNMNSQVPDALRKDAIEAVISPQFGPPPERSRAISPFRRKPNILEALRLGVGSVTAEFRSDVQRKAMEVVLKGTDDILICDRTGGGKSAVVFGPCLLEAGVTVYVSPLKSLLQDISYRCRKLELQAIFFAEVISGIQPLPSTGVLLVSPEQVADEEYRHAIGVLWASRRLCRIVFDEVHLVVLSENYRQCMTRMRKVRPEGVGAQLVLMSATSPPKMTARILASVGCAQEDVVVLRGILRRDNVGISVRHLEIGGQYALCHYVVEEVIEWIFSRCSGGGKCLVAALTRKDVDGIHTALQADVRLRGKEFEIRKHHSGMSLQERGACIESWSSAPVGAGYRFVMIATDGFGTGIDAPDVRRVIVAGCSRSLIDMWQVFGRIGRDGQIGSGIVLYHPSHAQSAAIDSADGKILLEEFNRWATNESDCRLKIVEEYLGCTAVSPECWVRKNSEGGPVEICDICAIELGGAVMSGSKRPFEGGGKELIGRAEKKRIKRAVRITVPNTQTIRSEIELLRARARRVSEHCVACLAATGRCGTASTSLRGGTRHGRGCFHGICIRCMSRGHDAYQCPTIMKPSRENGVKGCKACFLWTFKGEPMHEGSGPASRGHNEFGSLERCPFKDIVTLALGTWHSLAVRGKMIQYLDMPTVTERMSAREFALWLIRDRSSSGPGISSFADFAVQEFGLRPILQ